MQFGVPSASVSMSAIPQPQIPGAILVWIVRTSVDAIRCAISIGINVRDSAATNPRSDLVWIVRTSVYAIRCAVSIGINVAHFIAGARMNRDRDGLGKDPKNPIFSVFRDIEVSIRSKRQTRSDSRVRESTTD